MQAFPSKAKQIWEEDENSLNEDYEQIVPTTQEEFISIEQFLSDIQNMNAEELKET